jgi:hypothetical protein
MSGHTWKMPRHAVDAAREKQKLYYSDPINRAKAGEHNIGRKRSAECARKQKENNPGNTGHRHSQAAIEKIRAARAKQEFSDEYRRKLSKSATIAWARRKMEK